MTTPFAPPGIPPTPSQYTLKPPAKPAPKPKQPPRGAPFKQPAGPPAPTGPPIPVLQTTKNYHGSVTDINQRTQAVTDAYTTAYGQPPSPALTLDVVTSPLSTDQFPQLFTVPKNPVAARNRSLVNNGDPFNQLVTRHDGYVEANNPVRQLMTNNFQLAPQQLQAAAAPAPPVTPQKFQQLQAGHPWVAAGMLPLPASLLTKFWGAVEYAQNNPSSAKVDISGESVAQYQSQERLAEEMSGKVSVGNVGQLVMTGNQGQIEQTYQSAGTVKQAQDVLKQKAPDFFGGLSSTGYFNQDWATALGKYTSSTQYFRQQTLQTAQDNHFGSNTAAFIQAWKNKQSAIKKNPFAAQFLQHQPLIIFDSSSATNGALANYLTGNTKGWGWVNVPTWGLHALTATVGFGLDQVAGAIDQAKSEGSFAVAYMQAISPKGGFGNPLGLHALGHGDTEAQARQKAYKALVANPTWARVFDPGYTDTGTEGVLGKIANAAIDLSLGGVKFTGEEIAAGDVAKYGTSRYVIGKTNFAFNSLKQGDLGGAVASLEGGSGAEKLNVALEAGVKDGSVNLAQYRQYVTELAGTGHVTIRLPAETRAPEAVAPTRIPKGTFHFKNEADARRSIEIQENHLATPHLPDDKSVPLAKKELAAAREYLRTGKNPELPAKPPAAAPLREVEISGEGAPFKSLRSKYLPTPGKTQRAAQKIRGAVSHYTDSFENTIAGRKDIGNTTRAEDFISGLRQLTARPSPAGERRAIFDTNVPKDVYNFARVQLKATPKIASDLQSEFIRLRANEDIPGVADFQQKLTNLFMKANPGAELKSLPGMDTGGPLVESESLTHLYFPKALETRTQVVNNKLNELGRAQRETIVGGSPVPLIPGVFGGIPGFGESLAWKHAVADTTRRIVGGGGIFPVTRAEKALVEGYLKENPEAIREVSTARDSAIMGENRYVTGQKPTDPMSFRTSESEGLKSPNEKPVPKNAGYKAAGGYLRRHLTSKALKAYQASSKDDLGPMIDLVSNDNELRSLAFGGSKTFVPSSEWQKIPDGVSLPTGGEIAERNGLRYIRWPKGELPTPIRYGGQAGSVVEAAQALWQRYNEIEQAGIEAGVEDPLGDALNIAVKNVGPHIDEKLGDWIKENKLDFPVRSGLVDQKQWDDVTQAWVGTLMTANKWNRATLFDHVFHGTVSDLVNKGGWDIADAIPTAADVAKAQTVYHMLDFSNMLQVEQNLRWLSWFATKHRLYWSWLGKTLLQRPGLAAAVNDASQSLDSKGNLNFTLYGHRLYVPAARLFWVNATEYPQTSPAVQFLAEAGKGFAEGQGANALNTAVSSLTSTSGNVLTRDDQTWALAIKTALAYTGKTPLTTNAVTFGMPAVQARYFREAVNEYSVLFKQQHGDYPTEADAVKHVLLGQTAQSLWATNLFLPVESQTGATSKTKKLLAEYGAIVNPAKKQAFLDAHPDVALTFGVTQDPAVFLHNNAIWDQYNAASKQLAVQRDAIYQQILKTGHFTAANSIAMSALSAAWSEKITALQVQDAATWHGTTEFPAGKVSDGKVVTPGPWGVAFSSDPLAARAFLHQAFPGIAKPQLDSHTVGETIVQLQGEANLLKAANTDAKAKQLGYPDEVSLKSRLGEVNQILAPFFGYPKNAPGQLQSLYYSKFVGPYIKARDAKTAELALAPTDQQNGLRASFRAWKDSHDHPVKLTFQGHTVTFPSVVQIGWARLPAAQRTLGLAQAVTDDWAHVASYEKTMLGVPTSPGVSEGWSAFANAVQEYNAKPGNTSLVAAQKAGLAKQIDKVYPGFYKDYVFSLQPKIERYQRTTLYQRLPDKQAFVQYIATPAKQILAAISKNGDRTYYERAWRQYVQTEVTPWLNGQPDLKRALTDYGPDFLNTLVSPGG